jgi:Tfp pilus assembly protein PilN
MIEVNLLPEEFRKKEAVKLMLPEIPILKILPMVLGGFLALLILFVVIAGFQEIQYNAVRAQIADLTQKHGDMVKHKADTADLGKKLQQLESMAGRKFYWWKLMNSLSDSMTKGVWLRGLSISEMTVQAPPAPAVKGAPAAKSGGTTKEWFLKVEGSTVAQGQETAYVGKFIKELKDNKTLSGVFEGIELSDMNQRKIREYDVYDFVLMCKFKKGLAGKS